MDTRRRRRDRELVDHIEGIPSTPGDLASPFDAGVHEPTHEEIARRAYERYEQRGGAHAHDWDDWLQAERELRERARDRLHIDAPSEYAFS